jgi:hydrogenase nickel incorporation protein HypA/HybF
MHELSIADALVEIVLRHADGRTVLRVEVRVGHLRQVVPSALELAFELVARDTPAQGAELVLEPVPAVGRCRTCGAVGELPAFPLTCGSCGGWDLELLAGEELTVEALELDETALTTTGGQAHGG